MSWNRPAGTLASLALLLSSTVVSAAGWDDGGGADWQTTIAKAKQEGPIVAAACPEIYPISRSFKADTGLEVSWVVGDQVTTGIRFRAEIETGRNTMDLRLGGAGDIDEAKAGRLASIADLLVLPNVLGPDRWAGGHVAWVDNGAKYMPVPSQYVSTRPVINKDFVDPAKLHQLSDLLKPEFKGKIAAFDPTVSGSGQTAFSYFVAVYGIGFVEKLLKDQQMTISMDQPVLAEWAARGLYPIILGIDPAVVNRFRETGVTSLAFFTPDDAPGSLNGGCSVAEIAKNAPHSAGAKVFINWYLSAAGQQALVEATHLPSRRLDVSLTGVSEDFLPDPKVNYLDQYQEDWYLTQRIPLRESLKNVLSK